MKHVPSYSKSLIHYLALVFVCLVLLPFNLLGQVSKVMQYDVSSGLPQAYVYSMHQDASGYLWIGTGDGLARYDGKTFRVFTSEDSLCGNFITSSHIHANNSWFGHNNGGITHFNGKMFTKVIRGDLGTGSISDIKSNENITWASTQYGGIWKIGANRQATLFNDPDNQVPIFSFEILSSTELAIGSMDGVYIYSINNETSSLRLITMLENIPETKIQDMLLSRDKATLYILTQDEGIFTYDIRQYVQGPEPLGIDLEAGIEGPQQLYEDNHGDLWIPTFGYGIFKLQRDSEGSFSSWTNYNEENGLPGNNVKYVMQDREENIWLGMYGTGLARLVDEAYSYYSFDEEGVGNNIHAIFNTEKFLWFGTENGLIRSNRLSGEILHIAGGMFGLPVDRVTAITGSPSGNLWIGTSQNGVYQLHHPDGTDFRRIPISQGTLENSINAMEFDDSLLWIATDKGVCKLQTGTEELTWFTISNAGLPHNTVNYLQVDETGKVWLSTLSNTVSFIENDSVTRIIIPTVGGAIDIRSVAKDHEGQTWVGTYGNGVFKMEGDTATNYTSLNGLISDYCYSLIGDDLSYIWVSHRGGLSRIRLSDNYISGVKDEVGIERDMEFNENAVFKDRDGILWFGSTSGALKYDPHLEKSQPPPPALSVVSLMVNDEEMEVTRNLQLPPGRYDLSIQFIGINLKNPDGVTYSYNMEGLGNSWSDESSQNQVTYNKLPDGKYTFNLRATNSEGISSEAPVKVNIIISKPLWKRWWFYALLLIIVSSGVVAYIKRREYNLRIEKQVLEKAVIERTQEVVDQKEEIEHQRDAIKTQSDEIRLINQNLRDSIVYASRIQRALFPPKEKLRSYFPDSFIMNRPQYIVSGDFFWLAKKDGKQIVTVADCTGHGVPGAFMSMLGITLLNEIVNNLGILEADQILNRLKHEIIRALRQEGSSDTSSDGMDMALFVFDPASSSLQYSGGFNPLILIRDGEYIRYKADPMPIGIGAITGRDFTRHELDVVAGDQIYLYSDGYEDQFGGEKDKKFSRKRFREMLMEIRDLPMAEQQHNIERRLDDWMDGREQIDDITVMGIRF